MITPEQRQAADQYFKSNVNTINPVKSTDTSWWQQVDNLKVPETQPKRNLLSTVGNALISSEKGLASNIASAYGTQQYTPEQAAQNVQNIGKLIEAAHKLPSGNERTQLLKIANDIANGGSGQAEQNLASLPTDKEVIGNVAGVGADILAAGAYGKMAEGAKAGKLLVQGAKSGFAAEQLGKIGIESTLGKNLLKTGAKDVVKKTLGQTLKTIGKETLQRTAVGGGVGYGYDVIGNLQSGKSGTDILKPGIGTAIGVGLPLTVGTFRAIGAVTKDLAPRIVNSLVKPKNADFSYGKNPGRTVSEMGITGNNLNDFADNIKSAKDEVGGRIGAVYDNPSNANIRINGTDEISKIDSAIKDAAKGGKNNQNIVTQLQNIKDALLYEHGIDESGKIIRTSEIPRDLTNLNPKEAFNLKEKVAEATQFTGRPSDDKTVNSVLKDVYGGLKEKLNTKVGINNPEIIDLNQKYADLTSAEIATRNRDKIIQRSNMISLTTSGVAAAAAIVSAIVSGGATIPIVLGTIATGTLEKVLETTAARTRIAAWLGKSSPNVIIKVLQKNPELAPILRRTFPAMASKLSNQ